MKKIILGIDHGYGNMKTEHFCYGSSVTQLAGVPPLQANVLEYEGRYYAIGGSRMNIKNDKSVDEDYFLLSLVGIAKELSLMRVFEAEVYLGVGLPLMRVGADRKKFIDYLQRNEEIVFRYENILFRIWIKGVEIFPQGYAGIIDYMSDFKKPTVVVDIGSWTIDILYVVDGVPDLTRCKSIPQGTFVLLDEINEGLRYSFNLELDNYTFTMIGTFGTADLPEDMLKIVCEKFNNYTIQVLGLLQDLKFNPLMNDIYFIGGGASIMKNFAGELSDAYKIIENISINAKGYQKLLTRKLQRDGII